MATVLTISVKGNSKSELNKNFELIDSYMTEKQKVFVLVSSTKPNYNPRIYYSSTTVESKLVHDIINSLKTDKTINQAIRGIAFAPHLSRV